ncbi:hypothetical protein D1AOALGA4SA_1900 [Olavius algarvensis Delta 1 endosymbiont]|nr:hypothetical protein D1AOALGA4SA_1900 [Olavius algarvensis Delta 1 endosymbiont]
MIPKIIKTRREPFTEVDNCSENRIDIIILQIKIIQFQVNIRTTFLG